MKITEQIRLLEAQINAIDAFDKSEDHNAYKAWHMQTELLLKKIFGKEADEVKEFHRLDEQAHVVLAGKAEENRRRDTEAYSRGLKKGRSLLSGMLEFLKTSADDDTNTKPVDMGLLDALHTEVKKKCSGLYLGKHYSDAVEKGFKVVRDRLRELTTFEKGTDAFGRGGLYVNGATNKYVDKDFQEAVKFLTMAIDQFRNEKVHTSDGNIEDPVRAYEYLTLSSLAMHLLDDSELKEKPEKPKSQKPSKSSSKSALGEKTVSLDPLQIFALRLFAAMSTYKELLISRTSGGDIIHAMGSIDNSVLRAELNSVDTQEFEANLDEMVAWGLITLSYGSHGSPKYKLAKAGYDVLKEHPELKATPKDS